MEWYTVIDTAARVLPLVGVIGGGVVAVVVQARQRLADEAQRALLTAETEAIRVRLEAETKAEAAQLAAAQSAEIAVLNQRVSACHEAHYQTRQLMDERYAMILRRLDECEARHRMTTRQSLERTTQ